MPMSLTIDGSLERYRREPSPETALELHAQLLSYREFAMAADFRKAVLEEYPDHAALQAGLASHLDEVGRFDEATGLFESALRLDPNLPRARVGVAARRMDDGKLDEARRLLAFLEAPGAGRQYPLGLLHTLARKYQAEGRHEEALALAEVLLRELPNVDTQYDFRSFVRTSEKALGLRESILPPRRGGWLAVFRSDSGYPSWVRRASFSVAAVALVVATLTISNEFIRRHRTVFVVNATGQPVQVRVDGGPASTFGPGVGRLTLAEGKHRVDLGGAVDESHEVELRTEYYRRWFGRPAWVLNPGGEAVIDEQTLYYAKNPRPSEHRLRIGEPFVTLRNADYPFEPSPDSLEVKSEKAELVKVALEWIQGFDADAFLAIEGTDPIRALTFAERRLRRAPDQGQLLDLYLAKSFSGVPGGPGRALAFLESGLDRKPPSIRWHRAYQALLEREGREAELVAKYDRFLAADPKNAAWLYLRGRIEPDWDKQDEFYGRAIEADPNLPWPWMDRGTRAASQGRWEEAAKLLRKARELNLIEPRLQPIEVSARIATGGAEGVVSEYRNRLVSQPGDAAAATFLCDGLVAAGQADRIDGELSLWQNRLPAQGQTQLAPLIRALACYQAGKLEECEHLYGNNQQLRSSIFHAQVLMALGRVKEFAADPAFAPNLQDPWAALAVSLALALDGEDAAAASWRERACKALEPISRDYRRAAAILRAKEPTPVAEVEHIFMEPDEKALLLAVLGTRFPDHRREYFDAAARFNVRRIPPYQLVRRALEKPES